jgi:hypothetical protein
MDKYYLYIVNNKKSILLSSSNSKSELRDNALTKIGDKIKNYDKLYLYRIKLMKVPKKEIAAESNNKIKLIGGPLVAIIERILINVDKNKTKLKSIDDKTNKIYFSEKYLKTHNKKVTIDTINTMIWDWVHNKFNQGLFAVNIINE